MTVHWLILPIQIVDWETLKCPRVTLMPGQVIFSSLPLMDKAPSKPSENNYRFSLTSLCHLVNQRDLLWVLTPTPIPLPPSIFKLPTPSVNSNTPPCLSRSPSQSLSWLPLPSFSDVVLCKGGAGPMRRLKQNPCSRSWTDVSINCVN